MARVNRISAPKTGSSGSNTSGGSGYQSYLWIIFCLILLAIILFAIFYPRRQYAMSVHKIMSSDKPAMIFFYAPWCGHCKNAKPEFEKLMQMAKGKAHMIDCDAHQNIAQKYDVKGFPTIRYYPNGPKNGNPREYSGNRSAEDMMKFMQS